MKIHSCSKFCALFTVCEKSHSRNILFIHHFTTTLFLIVMGKMLVHMFTCCNSLHGCCSASQPSCGVWLGFFGDFPEFLARYSRQFMGPTEEQQSLTHTSSICPFIAKVMLRDAQTERSCGCTLHFFAFHIFVVVVILGCSYWVFCKPDRINEMGPPPQSYWWSVDNNYTQQMFKVGSPVNPALVLYWLSTDWVLSEYLLLCYNSPWEEQDVQMA